MVALSRELVQYNIPHIIGTSPFKALYSYATLLLIDLTIEDTEVPIVRDFLENKIHQILKQLKENINLARLDEVPLKPTPQ